jgi:hypothetical protein
MTESADDGDTQGLTGREEYEPLDDDDWETINRTPIVEPRNGLAFSSDMFVMALQALYMLSIELSCSEYQLTDTPKSPFRSHLR